MAVDAGRPSSSFSSSNSCKQARGRRQQQQSPASGRGRRQDGALWEVAAPKPFLPPLNGYSSSRTTTGSSRQSGDRFIPDRSAMDFDIAHFLLTESTKMKDKPRNPSRFGEGYQKLLEENLLKNRTRILAFRSKPSAPAEGFLQGASTSPSSHIVKSAKQRRWIPQSAEKTLDAPDILDDYYLNLLDWGTNNVLAIALNNTIYLWNSSNGSVSELVTVDEDSGPVTSVSWAPDGHHLAIGLTSSDVQLWDGSSSRLVSTLRKVHGNSRIGAIAWNSYTLTTGGSDAVIVNNDWRMRSHIVQTYQGHEQEVCGLKWSGSGRLLASGGNDNLLQIWDVSMASSNPRPGQNQWLHRFNDHTAAVKALAWCPFRSSLLASGGGGADQCIKFWNTNTGACLNSINTGSQVCSLLWNKHEHELLSSHGSPQNQLTLWKYPSMVKIANLTGHTSRVLFTAQSPDGYTVASAAGDETLRLWNVFGTPKPPKPKAKSANLGPFTCHNHIR